MLTYEELQVIAEEWYQDYLPKTFVNIPEIILGLAVDRWCESYDPPGVCFFPRDRKLIGKPWPQPREARVVGDIFDYLFVSRTDGSCRRIQPSEWVVAMVAIEEQDRLPKDREQRRSRLLECILKNPAQLEHGVKPYVEGIRHRLQETVSHPWWKFW